MGWYHKNAIVTGPIDSFCLACESHLKAVEDIDNHIRKPVHRNNLDASHYLEKYKDDCIRKVKRGYFCEFCNIVFPTAAKAGIHVTQQNHKENKFAQYWKREGNYVITPNNVCIVEKAWHGLVDDTCAVCNVEFENDSIHRNERSHVLKLIQKKVEFDEDIVYRKVDGTSFHCLTCNMILSLDNITSHSKQTRHKVKFDETHNLAETIAEDTNNNKDYQNNMHAKIAMEPLHEKSRKDYDPQERISKNDNTQSNSSNKNKIFSKLTEYHKCGIEINFESNTVFCKKCFNRFHFDFDAIETHIENHKYDPVSNQIKQMNKQIYTKEELYNIKSDTGNDDMGGSQIAGAAGTSEPKEDVYENNSMILHNEPSTSKSEIEDQAKSSDSTDMMVFSKLNHITYNKGHNSAFCRLCNIRLPSNLKNMREHVSGATHNNNEKKKQNVKNKILKKKLRDFVESALNVENLFQRDVVINKKFCVRQLSFLMFTKQMDVLRCQLCEVTLNDLNLEAHAESVEHQKAMMETPVLIEFSTEFVREVRPSLFHCGFCNLIVGDYEDLHRHLHCEDHKRNKSHAHIRLMGCIDDINEYHDRHRHLAMLWLLGRMRR